jgi:hypothetical protein
MQHHGVHVMDCVAEDYDLMSAARLCYLPITMQARKKTHLRSIVAAVRGCVLQNVCSHPPTPNSCCNRLKCSWLLPMRPFVRLGRCLSSEQ